MAYFPNSAGGGPQVPQWIYMFGGDVPGAGQTTSNSDSNPSAVTTFLIDGTFLGSLNASSLLVVTSGGVSYSYLITSVSLVSGYYQVGVTFQNAQGSVSAFVAGPITLSLWPYQMTPSQVGLGNVTNDAQVKVDDIGTTVPSPNGAGFVSGAFAAILNADEITSAPGLLAVVSATTFTLLAQQYGITVANGSANPPLSATAQEGLLVGLA